MGSSLPNTWSGRVRCYEEEWGLRRGEKGRRQAVVRAGEGIRDKIRGKLGRLMAEDEVQGKARSPTWKTQDRGDLSGKCAGHSAWLSGDGSGLHTTGVPAGPRGGLCLAPAHLWGSASHHASAPQLPGGTNTRPR